MNHINNKVNLIKSKISRNRIVMPPMDTTMANDGIANDFHIQHYGSRAFGGVGTIIVESTAVSEEGRIRPKDLGLWKDEQIEPLLKVTNIAHLAGSVIGVQLNHAGSKAELDQETFGTTKFYNYLDQSKLSIVTEKDIKRIEDNFVKAAKRAKKAGFDFVELHAAHGYLLNEIYHPTLNEVIKSDDITIRAKVIIDIVKRINTEVLIPVGIRMSVADDVESVFKIEDMKPLIEALDPFLDFIHVSSGEAVGRADISKLIKNSGTKLFRINYAKLIKQWTNKPLIVVGNFQTRNDVDQALKENIDFVAIGRELLFNPNLVLNTLLNGEEIDNTDYHWNNNLWFNHKDYKSLINKTNK